MKYLLFLLVALFLTACEIKDSRNGNDENDDKPCVSSNYPASPYSNPDDKTTYVSGDYKTITYTWYCKNGKYVSITFTQVKACAEWDKTTFSSNGICK